MLWLVPIKVEEIKVKYSIFENGGDLEGRVSINGLTMTGKLKLQREATEPNEAVNKDFVDNAATNLDASKIISGTMPVERFPGLNGDVISTAGSGVLTLKNTGVTPGSYTKVIVNGSGLVTSGSSLTEADIPGFGWEKITSGKPTTLAGYGITNAVNRNSGTVNGNITLTANPVAGDDVVTKGYADAALAGRVGFAVGDIVAYTGSTTPTGFLRCNGGEVSKTTYAALYSVVGDLFGSSLMPGSGKPWKQQYAFNTEQSTDITGWTTGTSLPGVLYGSQAIVTKNRVYLLGGGVAGDVATVYTAPINAEGTLGTWSTSTSLPGGLSHSQAIVTKNRVYLLGGKAGSALSTVYTAPINSDGTLGAWATGTPLPEVLVHSQAIVTKNRVYLLGGRNSGGGHVSTVYTAPINEDGTLGTWTTGTSLPGGLSHSQAIVTKNRVYLVSGYIGYSVATVYTAPINEDGTLGAWTTGPSLPNGIHASQAIVTKNRVYLLSGYSSSWVSTVYTAPINEDGTLGTWAIGTSLPGALTDSQAIVTKNRVYLLGGQSSINTTVSTVYTAPFSGGSNDYSSYYDGSIVTVTDPNNFRLPDYSSQEHPNSQYIIKT